MMYADPTLRIDPRLLETGVVYHKNWHDKTVVLVKDHQGVIEVFEAVEYEMLKQLQEVVIP